MLRNSKWLLIVVVTVFLAGCVISPRRPDPNAGTTTTTTPPVTTPPPVTPPPPPPTSPLGKLYVSNTVTPSIVRFDNALAGTTSGNIAPSATISGKATLLDTPLYILVDSANDRLYVIDGNPAGNPSILIWDSASTRTGNVAPTRNISGPATGLTQPVDMALDSGRNLLYVIDAKDVLVFSSVSTSSGNIAPDRILNTPFNIGTIMLDAANDRLFLADPVSNAIQIYDGASALAPGAITATRTLVGASTGLSSPAGLRIDSNGRLVVSNAAAPGITIYTGAATVTGNVAPVATISGGSTAFTQTSQIALRPVGSTSDELFVADTAGKVLIFANLSAATGNIAPTRNISGANTGLGNGTSATAVVRGVAIDPAH